ncbi:MAG: hypothetical protein OEL79_11415, partial [Chromatiales bacterium]|nr:hypothetical protein [Chromatiales bacterium]
MGDLEGALGAMRSYIHLGKNEKPQYIERARSALWEWEAQLKKPDYKRPTGYVPGSLSKSDMDKNLDEKSSILKDK